MVFDNNFFKTSSCMCFQAMKERMSDLAQSLGMPPGIGEGMKWWMWYEPQFCIQNHFRNAYFFTFYRDCELAILFIKLYRDLLKWWWTFYSPHLSSFFLLSIHVWIGRKIYESFFLPSQTKQALHLQDLWSVCLLKMWFT